MTLLLLGQSWHCRSKSNVRLCLFL